MVGNIASGKSTFAKRISKDTISASSTLVLNDDSIVEMLHGGDYLGYNKRFKPIYKTIENAIFTSAILAGYDLIIDRGVDIKKSSRKRWIKLAHSYDQDICAITFKFKSPEVHAKRRFECNPRGHTYEYWLEVARYNMDNLDYPSKSEGFYEIFTSGCLEEL